MNVGVGVGVLLVGVGVLVAGIALARTLGRVNVRSTWSTNRLQSLGKPDRRDARPRRRHRRYRRSDARAPAGAWSGRSRGWPARSLTQLS